MKRERQYYIIVTSEADFNIDIRNKLSIIGLPERYKKAIESFQYGDRIVFYVTKRTGFAGIAEVDGAYFYDNTQIWSSYKDKWPHRIKTKKLHLIENLDKIIKIKEIRDNLKLIENKQNWGAYFQGSLRRISEHDYLEIEQAFCKDKKLVTT